MELGWVLLMHNFDPVVSWIVTDYQRAVAELDTLIERSKASLKNFDYATSLNKVNAIIRQFIIDTREIRLKQLKLVLAVIHLDEKLNRICLDWPEVLKQLGYEFVQSSRR